MSEYLLKNYARFDLTLDRGEGSYLWDNEGRKYLDFGMGIAVCSLGHSHPGLTEAIQNQAGQLLHCSNLYQIPGQEQAAKTISEEVVGEVGKTFFCNSGAEANEAMIKLGRRYGQLAPRARGKRHEIITFTGSFHGRTFGGMSATAQEKVNSGFGPVVPGFNYLPFNDAQAVREAVGGKTCAVMLEIVQGEGGINVAEREFLLAIAAACRAHDVLLLVDDVQAGVGRTGDLCSWETVLGAEADLFQPDAVSWAKGIGGGYPLGCVWIRDRALESCEVSNLTEVLSPGTHGTTFGGAPLASAAMNAVLGEIIGKKLAENAGLMGEKLRTTIDGWGISWISEVRGLGLMIGVVIDEEAFPESGATQSGRPASLSLVDRLQGAGLLTIPSGTGVVRILPALNISESEVDEGLALIEKIFREI